MAPRRASGTAPATGGESTLGDQTRTPLSPTEFSSTVTAITAAFGDPTRRAIYLYAHDNPAGVTTAMVAEQFDLHANVARHHLDKLASGGYVEVTTTRRGHGAGRPSKRYRVLPESMGLEVVVRHDEVLVSLLGRALAELGPERSAELAEEVGEAYGIQMAESMGDHHAASFTAALHTVAEALSAHGFAAHAEKDGNKLRIVTEHCPFGDAVDQHPVICAVDRGMVRGMLGTLYGETSVDLSPSRGRSEGHCVTSVDD
ncbi:MAG: helix-turn-helix domain-containing protein [Microthrixaceae bacterium]|nr:helix-turn-helix domain-containing protein [Microthrixaceae bacterium]MCO5317563.1 helix-turn-helix domain-containing protein [Microthrixaceae bacterium]